MRKSTRPPPQWIQNLLIACAVPAVLLVLAPTHSAYALCGDCTDDGQVSASDALVTLRSAIGLETCEPVRCDTDDSGAVTSADALLILLGAVGDVVVLRCPGELMVPPGGADDRLSCQLSLCEEAGVECENGGSCKLSLLDGGVPGCDCTPYYSGDHCEQPVQAADDLEFFFRWRADCTLPGSVELLTPVPAPEVDLDGEVVRVPRSTAALRLLDEYGIVLDDTDLAWDDGAASALLRTVERFPLSPYVPPDSHYRVTRSATQFYQDFAISDPPLQEPWVRELAISDAAFTFANPIEQPPHEGVIREAYSNRLYRAVLRAFFPEQSQLEEVLEQRFGVEVVLGEPEEDFQYFSYDELVFLLSVFEDYPQGFRNLPNLRYLTRRKNGLVNPYYPTAPAIAWVSLHEIEFMDFAFDQPSEDYIHRLLAHELSHFVYDLLDTETLAGWKALSGWMLLGPGNWTASTNYNFVSAYAHDINPNEDFAETLSYYIYDPQWVRSIAPAKYDFLFEVVDGYEYVLVIDQAVMFEVFNLYPDTTFPGRIVDVTNTITGLADGSHLARMQLRISQPPYEEVAAFTRMYSRSGKFADVYFYPLDGDNTTLVATHTFGPLIEDGDWTVRNIAVFEPSGNTTWLGQKDFGWMLYFENEEVDLDPPLVDLDGMIVSAEQVDLEYRVRVDLPATDRGLEQLGGFAYLQHYDSGQSIYDYSEWIAPAAGEQWGQLVFDFVIRPYHASGTWTFRTFAAWDASANEITHDLLDLGATAEFVFLSSDPDHTAPELDLESVYVEAYSTSPEDPDGETDVYIHYQARDDIAGIGTVSYRLRKPSGDTLFGYHYHENFYGPYFIGDPTGWRDYTAHLRLPVGSEPGLWSLMELSIEDYAGNRMVQNFAELVVLAPVENLQYQ